MRKIRFSRSGRKRMLSWLLTLSMIASLVPAASVIPARAAGVWGVFYDAEAFQGENLILEVYDADSGYAELIEWTDDDGTRIADKSADELFGDGHSYYAVVQYQNYDAVMAEYRNYLISVNDLENAWAELPDTDEDSTAVSKETYGNSFDAYADAVVEQQSGNMTPAELQNHLDEMVRYGIYVPTGDYSVSVQARTVALDGEDPELNIDADFFADCVPVEWILPADNFISSDGSGGIIGGGDYSDIIGGDYSGIIGGDYSDIIGGAATAVGSLKLALRDDGRFVPVLVKQYPAGADMEDEEEFSAGNDYLLEKLGGVTVEQNDRVDGTVDPDYNLCVAPGDYTMIYEDNSSGTNTLDWEDFTASAEGASVDFSGARDLITFTGSLTGYLPGADAAAVLTFSAADGPENLSLPLSGAAVQCRRCTFENAVVTVSESQLDMSDFMGGSFDMANMSMTMMTSIFRLDPEVLNTSGAVRTLELGALSDMEWQGELSFTSDETGEAKDIYTAGEAVTGVLNIHNGEGLSLIYQFRMSGAYQDMLIFEERPTEELFNQLYTIPSVTVEYTDGEVLYSGADTTALSGFSFRAPESDRQMDAVYSFATADGSIDILATASEVIRVAAAADTEPPAVPSGFAAEVVDGAVEFTWDANGEEDLKGYVIYRTDADGAVQSEALARVDAGTQSASVAVSGSWGQGPWYFALSACDLTGNESPVCSAVAVQDPNADFYGETEVTVTAGTLADGVLTLADGAVGELTVTFTADPSLPAAGLPESLDAAVAYEDMDGQAQTASVTLEAEAGVYSAVWSVPAEAARLNRVSFMKQGAEIAAENLSCDIYTAVTLQIPAYDAAEYFTGVRLSGGLSASLEEENGAYVGEVSRVGLKQSTVSFLTDTAAYSCAGTLGDFVGEQADIYAIPMSAMPDLMVILPSWEPAVWDVAASVQLQTADGKTLSGLNCIPEGQNVPILIRNSKNAARVVLIMTAGSSELEVRSDDPICSGMDWQKGAVVSATGTVGIKDATSVMHVDIYCGANGDELYDQSAVILNFRDSSGYELHNAVWQPHFNLVDVSEIPAGTYTVTAGHNCTPVQVTLTGAGEIECPDLVQYDQIVFEFELTPALADTQPDSIVEEQAEEGFTDDTVGLLTDRIRVFFRDTAGERREVPLSDYGSYSGRTTLRTEPILLRDVDLDRALEVDLGGYVQLLIAGVVPYTQSWCYTDYRIAPLRDGILYTDDLTSALSREGLDKPVYIAYTGSPILTLQASPTVQINATRTVEETKAYFFFVSEDGSSCLEIADFAASRNGGKQIFRFDEMAPGTYDVLFYLSDTGRKMVLEQQFLNCVGEFVPPADSCAVGMRDVTFDDESNVLYLDTPDAPVDGSEPGMHNLSITPDKGVVMDGDLLSFTVKFTYVPEDHPYVMELRPLNFSDGAYSVSVKKADGTAVSCPVSDDGKLSLPNDQGILTGTIIYAGTACAAPLTVGAGLTIYELATDTRGDQWYYVVNWTRFCSSLGAEIQTNGIPVNGRSDAEPFRIRIVSDLDERAVSTVSVRPSRYGYWNTELTFPFTVETGMEESFTVTYQKEDGTELLTQSVSGTARIPILPAEMRYSYYMVDHADNRYDYTFVGRREDNYKGIRDANVTFGTDYGSTGLTLEVTFDDTAVNENGYTDAQSITTPTVIVHAGRSLYAFDMTPADKAYYTVDGQQIPYATTYTVTYSDVYCGPFEVCYDILNPNGVSVPAVDNPALPTEGAEYEALRQDWARMAQDIYDAGGALVNNGPDTTLTYVVEDAVFEEITCAELAPDDLPEDAKEKLEEEGLIFLSDEPRDLTLTMSNYTSVTAIEDIDAAIEALDAVEDEENPWLRYTREEGEDGVVAYIRYYNPRYAFVLSEEQPETLPGEEERVSLDLVVVQEYAKLYDFSALTQGGQQSEAVALADGSASAEDTLSLFGLFDDGYGPPENWGPKPMTVMDVGDGSLSMKDFAKAVVPGAANAVLETGEMVNKGIGVVDQAAEVVEILGLDPEELKASEGTDQALLGSKGAAALKVVDYAKKGYDAYNRLTQDENDPKKAKLRQVENDLKQVRDEAMQRCSCLLDEQGADIQMQIQAQYQEGLIKLQELELAIDAHEAVNDLVDIGQDVAPSKVNVYKAAADVSIDLTQKMADDIHDSQRWLEVNDTYRRYYNGISRLSFGCDPTKCDDQEPKVEDNLSRPASPYTGPIPASPVGVIQPSHVIDPSGVVYEGLLTNPLEGVTCTIQYKNEDTGVWTDWDEAPGYNDQTTVILSNKSGYYRWDVPTGLWRVKYYMEGYNGNKAVYSGEMPVPPVWLDVNQNMLANDSTPAAAVSSEDGTVLVTFDTPVQWSTVASGIAVSVRGEVVEGEWSIVSGGEGDIYADGITFGEDGLPAEIPVTGQLVTRVRFTPCEVPTRGSSFSVALSGDVESYGGAAMVPAVLNGSIVGGSSSGGSGGSGGGSSSGGSGGSVPSGEKTDTVTVSSKGGSYSAFDAAVKLTVEAGCFTADTDIRLTADDGVGYADTYDITFAVQPKDTVEITFRLDDAAAKVADVRKLGLWVKKKGSSQWSFAGGAYDVSANTLTLLTRMDGTYEVRYNSFAFPDLSADHWAYDFMDILASRRIMQGNAAGLAEPDRTVTRAEVATMLVNVLQANSLIDRVPAVEANFIDVDESDWYYYPLNLAAKRGLIAGYDGKAFALDNITREQLATMLARAVATDEELAAGGTPDFGDLDQISDWAKPFVAVMQAKGFMVGDENGNFNPQAKATRAEAAVLMYRAMEMYGLILFDPDAPALPCLTCPYSR